MYMCGFECVVDWGSMNSCDPLVIRFEGQDRYIVHAHGTTVYRPVTTSLRSKPPHITMRRHKSKQASQVGIGLLKSSESARRPPLDAAMNHIMQITKKHADDKPTWKSIRTCETPVKSMQDLRWSGTRSKSKETGQAEPSTRPRRNSPRPQEPRCASWEAATESRH
jgi:hypothetical protein